MISVKGRLIRKKIRVMSAFGTRLETLIESAVEKLEIN